LLIKARDSEVIKEKLSSIFNKRAVFF